MKTWQLLFILSFLSLSVLGDYNQRVLLEDVQTLTLHRGRTTQARRTSAIPQLRCRGRNCKDTPDVVQCYNRGKDHKGEIQWECKAELPKRVKFGPVQVSCEGYSSPQDNFILAGSCGLEYNLERVSGYKSNPRRNYRRNDDEERDYNSNYETSNSGSGILGFCIVVGLVVLIYYGVKHLVSSSGNNNGGQRPLGANGPPPPYSPESREYTNYGANNNNRYNNSNTRYRQQQYNNNNNQPGFWSGVGLGSIFGGWGGYSYGRSYNNGAYYGGSNNSYRSGYRSGHRDASRSSSSSSNNNGNETRTASGFGGTSNR